MHSDLCFQAGFSHASGALLEPPKMSPENSDNPRFSYPPAPRNPPSLRLLKLWLRLHPFLALIPFTQAPVGCRLHGNFIVVLVFLRGFRHKNLRDYRFFGSFATKDPGRVGIRFLTREEIPQEALREDQFRFSGSLQPWGDLRRQEILYSSVPLSSSGRASTESTNRRIADTATCLTQSHEVFACG